MSLGKILNLNVLPIPQPSVCESAWMSIRLDPDKQFGP